ncbi:hypothetical protein NC653_040184 [Populus alba x Populus x berolinensis]|uniref:Uncharacterized protein n=1 Tax=Populus alba x Populus x berolinensis TaxID=444605 RepID=A0AAD6LFP9_9ROSI|nr:hypothetical protein NC653_040184 [Populus alba x Populus x berolinensis]
MTGVVVVGGKFFFKEETNLAAHRTCVLPGRWKIISRFDSYGHDSEPKDELVILMDATGNGLLALHRKVSSFFLTFSWIDSKTFGGSSPGLTIIINIHVLTVTLRQ